MEKIALNQLAITLREKICQSCDWRAGEDGSSEAALTCEEKCALFVHLPSLTRLIAQYGTEPPCGYDDLIEKFLRFAHERSPQTTGQAEAPLRAYAADSLAVIERLVAGRMFASRQRGKIRPVSSEADSAKKGNDS